MKKFFIVLPISFILVVLGVIFFVNNNAPKKLINNTDKQVEQDINQLDENDFEEIDADEFLYFDEETTSIDNSVEEINNDLTNLNAELDFESFDDIEY